jgi:ABC-type multidrug transport system fused ATPase/permease subunit
VNGPSTPRARGGTSTLREGFGVIGRGIRDQPRWFALAVLGSVVYGVMTGLTAWAIGWVVDHSVTPAIAARHVTAAQLWTIGGVLALVVLVNVVGVIGRRLAGGIAMFNLGAMYRQRVTRQYLRLPLAWHHRHPSGQLLSNANADVEATWNIFAPLPMALGVVVMLVFGIVQMAVIDPWLALVGLTVFPMLFAANVAFQRAMSPRVTRAQQLRADVSEVAHESFEAALVVKSLGREDHEAERFAAVTHELRDANVEVGRTRGRFDPAIEAIPTLGTLAVLLVGTLRVRSGYLSAAQVVQIAYLFSILAFPVRALGWVLAELPRAVVGWRRIEAVLEATGGMTYGTRELPKGRSSHLQADGLAYAYEIETEDGGTDLNPAVVDVTLDLAPGSTVAVVGPTGSGKTTLTNLVLRLVDPDSGAVLLDGVDLREVRKGGVSDVAALVAQQTFMFDDSVRGNVTLGGDHDDEAVWHALNVAQGAGFVERLPDALDTRVGERGASLSGGQRQRIALARAVVREPQLLVLDDATSAVDPSVEQAILARLREASSGTTVLVVAYRMATILLADQVVYVEAGRVVDHGRHDELMRRCAGYERLVTAYAREAAERAALAAEAGGEDLDEYDLDGYDLEDAERPDGRGDEREAVR